MPRSHRRLRRLGQAALATAGLAALSVVAPGIPVLAASSSSCSGTGFAVLGAPAEATSVVSPPTGTFRVQGSFIQFDVVAATFEIQKYTFLPTDDRRDMTGGVDPLEVWAYKQPQHSGQLTSDVTVRRSADSLSLQRSGALADGTALSMKIQAKDCAAGGIFQMEVERGDGAKTRFVHRLADPAFYFDNANFRERIGQWLTVDESGDIVRCDPDPTDPDNPLLAPNNRFCVQVSARTNIGSDQAEDFVARDSPQGGAPPNNTTRIGHEECAFAKDPSVRHCGGVSVWDVASGGRMGFVSGEDAVEVANPPTQCVEDCQAQNQVRGRLAVLDFPFPVPADDRFTPRLCDRTSTLCPVRTD